MNKLPQNRRKIKKKWSKINAYTQYNIYVLETFGEHRRSALTLELTVNRFQKNLRE